jgi:hypothetical protein
MISHFVPPRVGWNHARLPIPVVERANELATLIWLWKLFVHVVWAPAVGGQPYCLTFDLKSGMP